MAGSGTYHEWQEERVVLDHDDEGNECGQHYEYHSDSYCRTHGFRYKLNVYNTCAHSRRLSRALPRSPAL